MPARSCRREGVSCPVAGGSLSFGPEDRWSFGSGARIRSMRSVAPGRNSREVLVASQVASSARLGTTLEVVATPSAALSDHGMAALACDPAPRVTWRSRMTARRRSRRFRAVANRRGQLVLRRAAEPGPARLRRCDERPRGPVLRGARGSLVWTSAMPSLNVAHTGAATSLNVTTPGSWVGDAGRP
jgi:hypothetical protein